MAKNTLINSLKLLSKEDLDKFEKYLDSPYFNTRKQFLPAFRYLRSSYEVNKYEKKELYRHLFPGKKYNDTNFRKAISDLNGLIEDFLGQIGIEEKDKELKYVRMMEMMQDKGLLDSFNSAYKNFSKKPSGKLYQDDSYYQNIYRAELLNCYIQYDKSNAQTIKNLEKASHNLNLMFIYSKLNIYRDILLYNITTGSEINTGNLLFDEVIKFTEFYLDEIRKEHPTLYIIYLAVKMTLETGTDHYSEELKNFLNSNFKKLQKLDITSASNYLISYYWININNGKTKYFSNLMELYKITETQGIFKFDKFIPHNIVNSIFIVGLRMQEYDWLEYFLEKYRYEIDPEYSEDVYNLSIAKLKFAKKRYEEVLRYVNKISKKDPVYFMNARLLILKTLYETGDIESTRYIIDSFKHYISRNKKLSRTFIQMNKLFIRFYLVLLQLRSGKKIPPQMVLDQMDEVKDFIPSRSWLVEKIEETNSTGDPI